MSHLFLCLTPDVEVLTPTGWVRGTDVKIGDTVAQWDPATGQITMVETLDTFRAPYSGDLVRFQNADTDQLVTPNHRVYHRSLTWKAWSNYRVKPACEIGRKSPIRLPLAGLHDGPGIGSEDYAALLGWVWTEGGFDASGTGVRIYQSSVNADKVAEIDALLDRLGAHRRYAYDRTYESRHDGTKKYRAVTWYISGDLAERVRADLPGKHPTYDLLWRMTLGEKRAFLRAALLGDGSKNKTSGSWSFEQKDPADREWFCTLLATVGQRGCNYARKARDGGSVSITPRADTTISAAGMKNASEHYAGDVWCLQVPTGAFVARRNGQIFITGNSGFPKSLDVSKAIDKAAGALREVSATESRHRGPCGEMPPAVRCLSCGKTRNGTSCVCLVNSGPATDDAKRWNGWGTALKPALEDWWLVRKPLESTVASNVLAHGTGALNIDACRIGDSKDVPWSVGTRNLADLECGWGFKASADTGGRNPNIGRWPPHLLVDEGVTIDGIDDPARYFYAPKPGTSERDAGLDHLEARGGGGRRNTHPTVKSVALMRWLIRLITPPGGLVLDPFTGSGTTGVAALAEGCRFVGCEMTDEYLPVIEGRIRNALQPPPPSGKKKRAA